MTDKTYKILLLLGALLMAGCSQEMEMGELESSPVKEGLVPVSVSCWAEESDGGGGSLTRAGKEGEFSGENRLLFDTGFGLFMGHLDADTKQSVSIDMMYNQQVKYSFLADMEGENPNPYVNGYWSYSPLKYWPGDASDIAKLFFCAYAPYVQAETLDGTGTDGITRISGNTQKDPCVEYHWSDKYEKTVDLLWSYYEVGRNDNTYEELDPTDAEDMGMLVNKTYSARKMTMRHALARLDLMIKLSDASTIDLNTNKVLVRKITLQGNIATKGTLQLNRHDILTELRSAPATETKPVRDVLFPVEYYPVWTVDPADVASTTITISNADNGSDDYCSLDNKVRYLEGYGYEWRDAEGDGLTTEEQDALHDFDTGRKAYIYLIPREAALELTPTVYYTILPEDGEPQHKKATPTGGTITVPETGYLKGNKTYHLTLTLTVT